AQQFNIKHKELLKTIPKYNQTIINGSMNIIDSQTKVTYLLYFGKELQKLLHKNDDK
ncbi:25682_t:CDS:1, partial [Gigaspora margarita]